LFYIYINLLILVPNSTHLISERVFTKVGCRPCQSVHSLYICV